MRLASAILLFSTSLALAEPVNFSTPLLAQDGKPKIECLKLNADRSKCEEEITVTLGWLCRLALDLAEDKIQPIEILRRGLLSERIAATDGFELSGDNIKLLKDQIIKLNYSTFIKFQAIRLIDPQGAKDAK